MIHGKLNWFTRKDILKFDKGFNLQDLDEKKLYDLLEEQMLDMGFVLFDNDLVFDKEIIVRGWHERRYSCMVLKGVKRKGRFILKTVGVQFWHIS
jgi:hypothetical protein